MNIVNTKDTLKNTNKNIRFHSTEMIVFFPFSSDSISKLLSAYFARTVAVNDSFIHFIALSVIRILSNVAGSVARFSTDSKDSKSKANTKGPNEELIVI